MLGCGGETGGGRGEKRRRLSNAGHKLHSAIRLLFWWFQPQPVTSAWAEPTVFTTKILNHFSISHSYVCVNHVRKEKNNLSWVAQLKGMTYGSQLHCRASQTQKYETDRNQPVKVTRGPQRENASDILVEMNINIKRMNQYKCDCFNLNCIDHLRCQNYIYLILHQITGSDINHNFMLFHPHQEIRICKSVCWSTYTLIYSLYLQFIVYMNIIQHRFLNIYEIKLKEILIIYIHIIKYRCWHVGVYCVVDYFSATAIIEEGCVVSTHHSPLWLGL